MFTHLLRLAAQNRKWVSMWTRRMTRYLHQTAHREPSLVRYLWDHWHLLNVQVELHVAILFKMDGDVLIIDKRKRVIFIDGKENQQTLERTSTFWACFSKGRRTSICSWSRGGSGFIWRSCWLRRIRTALWRGWFDSCQTQTFPAWYYRRKYWSFAE